jgi:hypothetical protein
VKKSLLLENGSTELSMAAASNQRYDTEMGRIDPSTRIAGHLAWLRLLLPLGWILAAVGYYGPWIDHPTAALTLSGGDMAEFVKFLPGVLAGTLSLMRQLFYLPPLAIVASVAFLVASERLAYPRTVRLVALLLSVPLSLQILPPAWSLDSLATPEFRLQALALILSWLMLAGFWLLGRLPVSVSGTLTAALSLAGVALPIWQMVLAKPAINGVYGKPPALGWGFFLCPAGLAIVALVAIVLALQARRGAVGLWAGR